MLESYIKRICVSNHALDHLHIGQRKLFKEEELIKIVRTRTPCIVGIQENNKYSIYYRQKDHFIKIIADVNQSELKIITFINTINLPRKWNK